MLTAETKTRPEELRDAMERMARWAERRLAALRREDYGSELAFKRELTRRRNAVERAIRIRQALGA